MIRSVVPRTAKLRRTLATTLAALAISTPALAQEPAPEVPGLIVARSAARKSTL